MRKRHILLGTLALAVVAAAAGGVAYTLHTRAPAGRVSGAPPAATSTTLPTGTPADEALYPALNAPIFIVCPGPTYRTTGDGLPAIHPRNDCTPSFTQQDVRSYLAHGVREFLGTRTQVSGQPTVTRVVFFTIGDLGNAPVGSEYESWRSSMVVNYPPDMLVCYAGLSGTFTSSDGLGGPPSHESAAFIVFDAHTGDQFGYGLGAPLG